MVSLTIDGKTISVPAESTILEAAQKAGITIPTLCWLQKISPTGACRICVVDVEGIEKPMTACNTPVKEGIKVTTQSERLGRIRRQVVQLLLVNHPLDCPVCDAGGECSLQDVCHGFDVEDQPFAAEDVAHEVINSWPLIQQVPSRCILCEKCVKVCHEVVGASALVVREVGERAFIDTADGKPLDCEFCGNCISACPTGTLLSKPFMFKARPWEMTRIRSVCTYCSSQCEVDYNVKQDKILRVTSEDGTTVNDGNLCIGGNFGYGYVDSDRRLTAPRLSSGGVQNEASWEEALSTVTAKIKGIRDESGAGAIAGLGSPRLTNEENYLFQKLFRSGVGTNNIDSEARFGIVPSYRALRRVLGINGASGSIERISKADAVLVFGCDVTAEAPMIDWAIEQACRKRDGKLVVANMRRVKLTRFANSTLQYRPGSEIWLANALARLLFEQADPKVLEQSISNLDQMKSSLAAVDLEQACRETGLPLSLLQSAAGQLSKGQVALIFGRDILRSENAEAKTLAVANLALLTGALQGDAGGVYPVDEKGNMQGLLDMGVYPEGLPGGLDYETARGRFESAWGARLPEGGLNALQILEGIENGAIRFLYLAGTNPLVTFPESARWRRALDKLEFLVVQDILDSDLVAMADVVLPGASSAEKTGTMTSLDHRTSSLVQAVSTRGNAREDLEIFLDLYRRIQSRGALSSLDEVREEMKSVIPAEAAAGGEKVLSFSDVDGGTVPTGDYQVLSGKILFHFGTTSTYSEGNLEVSPAGYIEMHPEDATSLGIREGDTVEVASSAGSAQGPVTFSGNVPRGLLFAPHHFQDVNIQQIMSGGNLAAVQVKKA